MSFELILQDQARFNKRFWPDHDGNFEVQSRQAKELILQMLGESTELLRELKYKVHRRQDVQPNFPAIHEEWTDMFKFLLTLGQVLGIDSVRKIEEEYWRKSAVCEHRYKEEFVARLDKDTFISVDIDEVICSYRVGFLRWVQGKTRIQSDLYHRCDELIKNRVWLDAKSLQVDEQYWQGMKHRFRTERGKLTLEPISGAKEFLERIHGAGYKIILLTSRPFDQYPNLYAETLEWLNQHQLPFDCLWWGGDKAEVLLSRGVAKRVTFHVDDDPAFITKLAKAGIPCVWVDRQDGRACSLDPLIATTTDIRAIRIPKKDTP